MYCASRPYERADLHHFVCSAPLLSLHMCSSAWCAMACATVCSAALALPGCMLGRQGNVYACLDRGM